MRRNHVLKQFLEHSRCSINVEMNNSDLCQAQGYRAGKYTLECLNGTIFRAIEGIFKLSKPP